MRLGILGGTFDPVHYGHLLLAESCREALRLDQVWFLPAAVPPHKQQREHTPGAQRVEMLELAIGGHAAFSVCQVEIARGGVNYTVDTLARLKDEDPLRELFFLMGADSLLDLPTWKEPARLCQLATPVAVCRSIAGTSSSQCGEPLDLLGLENLLPADRLEAIRKHRVEMPRIDLTSSDIRQRVSMGKSIRYRTPRAVERYIETHALYRNLVPESGQPGRCHSGC
jgi:nicotinate-nucleotide adenylyltransferase